MQPKSKFRSGPFKGQRLCEIPIIELYKFINQRIERKDADDYAELIEIVLDETNRRTTGETDGHN